MSFPARLHPNAPAVAMNDLLADREADTCATVCVGRVQALEKSKDKVRVLGCNADSIVMNGYPPFGPIQVCANGNLRSLLATIFDCIAYQVLKQLHEVHLMHEQVWEQTAMYGRSALLNRSFQIPQCTVQRQVSGYRRGRQIGNAANGLRIREQVSDKRVHAPSPLYRKGNILVCLRIEPTRIPAPDQITVQRDHAQRFSQVVGGGVGELLEIGICTPERLIGRCKR